MDQSTTTIPAPHDKGQYKSQTSVATENLLNNGPINPPPPTAPMPPPIAPCTTVLGLVPLRPSSSAAASSSVASSNNNHSSSGNNGQNGGHTRRRLEVKRFPIVLGRDNLAQWWYHSCSCKNYYCRLNCRPVAQNVGSLSKVMIQIGSVGDVHIVGKNPHLVAILSPGEKAAMAKTTTTTTTTTPNRTIDDEPPRILREHDILSIGRRDREPWMRFLVVRSPTHTQPSATSMDAGATVLPPPKLQPILPAALQPLTATVTATNILERKQNSPGSPQGVNNSTNATPAGSSSQNPVQNARQEHDAIMANLNQAATDAVTRGEAAAAAAPSTPPQDLGRERRNKQEKQKRKRSDSILRGSKKSHTNRNSSGNGTPGKAAIRTAEDLCHNGSKSRSRRLRIHLLFPDYERSAQLVRATQRGVLPDTGGGRGGGVDDNGLHKHHTTRFYSYSANQQFPRAGNFLTNGPALVNNDPGTVAADGATGSLEMAGNTTTADTSDQDASQRDATQDEPEASKVALRASGVSTNLENLSQNYAAALLTMANKETDITIENDCILKGAVPQDGGRF